MDLDLAVPAAEQIEILRRSVRYLIAIERIREKSKQLNLTDEQKSQLREQEATRTAEAESALLKLYAEVWLPKVTSDGIVIDVVAMGGRPLQTTLNEKKQARVHDRVMELLVDVQRRVFSTVNPSKIIELFKLGEGNPPTLGIKTADVVDGFYSFLGFPRLVESAAIKKGDCARHPGWLFRLLLRRDTGVRKRRKVSSAFGPRALQRRGQRRRDRHGFGLPHDAASRTLPGTTTGHGGRSAHE